MDACLTCNIPDQLQVRASPGPRLYAGALYAAAEHSSLVKCDNTVTFLRGQKHWTDKITQHLPSFEKMISFDLLV